MYHCSPFERFLTQHRLLYKSGESLAKYTTFRTGGSARYLVEPRDTLELSRIIREARQNNLKLFALGNGSNILVRDRGVDGVVIRLCWLNRLDAKGLMIVAGSGANLPQVVELSMQLGLEGLEVLAGIPGSVGGSVATNAGGKYGEIMQVVCRIEGVDREGEICSYERKDIRSQYRATDLGGLILTEVSFLLKPADPERIRQRYREIIDERGSTQPLGFSAGCIFRNPSRSKPAGKLIESCGLKGHRIGGAHISTKHANFIINDGSATSSDILALIELVQQRVYQEFGIELRLEIEVW